MTLTAVYSRETRLRQHILMLWADAAQTFARCGDTAVFAEACDHIDALLADAFADVSRETISSIRPHDE